MHRFQDRMAASSLLDIRNDALRSFITRLSRSRFFTISAALHFLFVLSVSSVVLVRQAVQKSDFEDTAGGLVNPPAPTLVQDTVQQLQSATDVSVSTAAISAPRLTAITSTLSMPTAFALPSATATLAPTASRLLNPESANAAANGPQINGINASVARSIKGFANSWRAPGDSGSGVGKERAFKFTAYIAKYSGGDWAATVQVAKDGKITQGSLPNLLYIIKKWSSNKIDAEAQAVPLNIAGDELFTIKPPFIFFSGHKDFKLSPKEVENLNKYINLGGAIWGDSSLPGSRSRFDIAFRREMKRVLPDQDKQWETLPPDHPLFTRTYFPEIREAPSGMNYFQEPVYALKNLGEIAVLYTANDYGDMWQIGITDRGEYDLRRDEKDRYVAMNYGMFQRREIYFRNLELKALNDSYRFGTNIVLHLLTRWDEKLRNVPTGL
jgi:hypothetical protein